ncbi:somatostatin receptor type 2-like [Dendronephthya gigantea]|uniref:somatostatin receptor type 2-like n=1 Tax=Dendronephthya gigantea TaxID=151771 RepID=UPI00106D3F4D|nr:somatostatin receptor type 2-like [Dendronephthya gigantea]
MTDMKYLNLIFLFVVNICFFLSGICLNSLVIISFWRSAQLRKKLCYFMIMVLSCCDLFSAFTNHSFVAYIVIFWLTGNRNDIGVSWTNNVEALTAVFLGPSILALLVMNFDRYLATYHPIFHRTSVTKGKLLTLFAILLFLLLVLILVTLNSVIPLHVAVLTFFITFAPPMLFMNYKLFIIAKKSRAHRRISPDRRNTSSLKDISSCLLAVACFVALSTPVFVYCGLSMNSKMKMNTFDGAQLPGKWARTIGSMNATFNCLIFYWKDKILRTEGMKVIKSIKIC